MATLKMEINVLNVKILAKHALLLVPVHLVSQENLLSEVHVKVVHQYVKHVLIQLNVHHVSLVIMKKVDLV